MAENKLVRLTAADQTILDELAEFLPDRVLDAHAHLWRVKDCRFPPGYEVAQAADGTIQSWRESQIRIFGPGRVRGGLFLGEPRSNPDAANDYIIEQLRSAPESRAALLITPDYPREKAVEYLSSGVISGFKPYHTFSSEKPTFASSIASFLTEWAWELAEERRLVIVLHLVKELALADPGNQREIREKCERYPNAVLILAHAGRGFHAPNTVKGLAALRGHLLPGLQPLGVPRELRGTALTFRYDREDEFREIVEYHGKDLAAVVIEPCRYHDPKPGFLEGIVDRAHRAGALVIFDEITIGWRLVCGGGHLKFGVNPDIAVFAKALGNGHPMAAIIGRAAAMEGAHLSFISSTYWTESIGPAAALAAVRKMRRIDVPGHVERIGRRAMDIWRKYGLKYGLPLVVNDGYPCLAHFRFDHEEGNELRTYYTQLMLERGFLAGLQFYPSLAHNEEVLTKFERAADGVFAEIADALQKGNLQQRMKGPPAHTGFTRLL